MALTYSRARAAAFAVQSKPGTRVPAQTEWDSTSGQAAPLGAQPGVSVSQAAHILGPEHVQISEQHLQVDAAHAHQRGVGSTCARIGLCGLYHA